MKKVLFIAWVLFCALHATGQIMLEKGDLVKRDTSYEVHFIPDSIELYRRGYRPSIGEAGPQQVYDFRWLDSLYHGTRTIQIKDIKNSALAKEFPDANAIMPIDHFIEIGRNITPLNTNDFPKKNDTFHYVNIDTENDFFDRYARGYMDYERLDANETYRIDNPFTSYLDSSFEHFIDPALTPWKDDYPDAEAARVVFEDIDKDGNLRYRVYEFYKTVENEFVKYGVGAQIDEGILRIGKPNGTYRNVASPVSPSHTINYSALRMGDSKSNFSTWRAETKAGYTTLRHFDLTIDTFKVTGYGVAYLESDSFEVVNIRRHVKRYWSDSLVTPFITQVQVDSSSVYTYEMYAKGYGLPVVVIETGPSPYEVYAIKNITSSNKQAFSPLVRDTLLYEYNLLDVQDESVHIVGHSYLVDQYMIREDGKRGVFDSLHSPYSNPQLYMSTAITEGFFHEDSARYKFEVFYEEDDISEFFVSHKISTEVEGYGTLLRGSDSTDVLRVWVRDSIKTMERWYNGSGQPQTDWTVETRYELWFLAKRSGLPLVRFQMDQSDSSLIWRAHFMDVPSPPNSIPSRTVLQEVGLFPNPAQTVLNVVLPYHSSFELRFYNASGELVTNSNIYQSIQLNVASLPPGMYLLHLFDRKNGTQFSEKITVGH